MAMKPRTDSAVERIAKLAAAWDAARAALRAADTEAADAQAAYDVAVRNTDTTGEQREEALRRLNLAEAAVATAKTEIEHLRAANPDFAEPAPAPELADGRITVTVIGPARGRRRAGMTFNAAPSVVAVTPEELALLQGDGGLAVTLGGTPPAEMADIRRRLALDEIPLDAAGRGRIKVLGPASGRRRAGFQFGPVAREVEVGPDQLRLILADEQLAVSPA